MKKMLSILVLVVMIIMGSVSASPVPAEPKIIGLWETFGEDVLADGAINQYIEEGQKLSDGSVTILRNELSSHGVQHASLTTIAPDGTKTVKTANSLTLSK